MALKIVEITKGYGRRIGNPFAYQCFWDFPATIIKAEIELDLEREEDKIKLKEINAKLFQVVKALVNADIKAAKEKDSDLAKALEKISEKVENA